MKTKEQLAKEFLNPQNYPNPIKSFLSDEELFIAGYDSRDAEVSRLMKQLEIAKKAVQFYSDKENWDDRWIDEDPEREGDIYDVISRDDVETESDEHGPYLTYGGILARKALQEIKKIGGEK